jgi:hypothetical protein
MFIVSRTSQSGGQEYLIEGLRGLRWDKVPKKVAHRYNNRSTATRTARRYRGSAVTTRG